jgi:hypothetical protein
MVTPPQCLGTTVDRLLKAYRFGDLSCFTLEETSVEDVTIPLAVDRECGTVWLE